MLIPVLKDAGESGSTLGQLVIAAGSIADFGAIILLSIFFTGEGGHRRDAAADRRAVRAGGRASSSSSAARSARRAIRADLLRLQDTTAQIRVRGAMVLLVAFAAIAESLGLEAILGAFAAGAILTLLDADQAMTHPDFRRKLEAIGFGFFIPAFFVTTGVRFDLDALLASASTLAMVPLFVAALLVVRGLPALLYRRLVGARRAAVAGLLQATSLPFIVTATAIGLELGVLDAATGAALVAAGPAVGPALPARRARAAAERGPRVTRTAPARLRHMSIPAPIQQFIDRQADAAPTRYDDLRAVVFNGTLKRSPEPSQTEGLLAIARGVLERVGVQVDVIRTVDHVIPPGVWPDMTTQGYERDDFPRIYRELVEPADIILIAGPIWLGDQSSQTRTIIERLYAYSGDVNEAGQWSYYGKVGGALTTGNEDGGKHVSAQVLYALQHIGVTVPPQSDAYWNGEAGPGDSYSDPGSGGPENAWTTRNTVFMTWNLLHFARMLKDAGGVPAYGNSTHDWDLSHPEHPNPEYR